MTESVRRKKSVGLALIFALLVLGSCASSPPAITSGFVLYFTSNRQGEIEPCGCQVNQIGGLNRLQAYFARKLEKSTDHLFVDSGDTYFSNYPVNQRRLKQETLRAFVIARAHRRLGLGFFTPGEKDFAAGLEVLRQLEKESGATTLAANLVDAKGDLIFPAFRIVEKGGIKVLVTGIVDENAFSKVPQVKATAPEEALKRVLSSAGKFDRVILLSHLGLSRDRAMAALLGQGVIVGSHSLDVLEPSEEVGKVSIVQTKNEGQQLGKVILTASVTQAQLVDLGKEYEEENESYTDALAYREEVRKLSLAEAEGAFVHPPGKEAYVANVATCRACHAKQFDFWRKTTHASAYLDLFAKNQHLNPDCIGCHTLGFQDPRGFQLAAKPLVGKKVSVEPFMKRVFGKEKAVSEKVRGRYHEDLKQLEEKGRLHKSYLSVQCEHCHGNRAGHPSPSVITQKKVVLSSCTQCHRPPNAREFDPKSISKVACPLSAE